MQDSTPIWQLTVKEFTELINNCLCANNKDERGADVAPRKRYVYGIAGIAQLFNCSATTANRIKASGKIDAAISQCGRMITVDAELALQLMKKKTEV